MNKKDKYNKNFTQKVNPINKSETEVVEDWKNEHGDPDFSFLQSLLNEGSPASREKIIQIASDLDVDFDDETPMEELVGRIRMATSENEDSDLTVTD